MTRKCIINKGCFYKICYAVKSSSLPGVGEGNTFIKGNLCPAFGQKGGERIERFSCFSVEFSSNNPYAKVAYFGIAYSDLLQ